MFEGAQVALVTGGGHRIGRALAEELGRAGFGVVVHYRNSREEAAATVDQLEALGVGGFPVQADLSEPAEVARMFETVAHEVGRLDILINSAASFDRGSIEDLDVESWDASLNVNLRGPFLCLQRAVPLLKKSALEGGGVAINIADLAGVQGWSGYLQHGVAKAGLLHLTKSAALSLAPEIRVNAIVPGAILPPPGESEDSDAWRRAVARVPLARGGGAAAVAHAVRYLVGASFVTGDVLFVDGGEHLVHSRSIDRPL